MRPTAVVERRATRLSGLGPLARCGIPNAPAVNPERSPSDTPRFCCRSLGRHVSRSIGPSQSASGCPRSDHLPAAGDHLRPSQEQQNAGFCPAGLTTMYLGRKKRRSQVGRLLAGRMVPTGTIGHMVVAHHWRMLPQIWPARPK